jgi:hypothetical protein
MLKGFVTMAVRSMLGANDEVFYIPRLQFRLHLNSQIGHPI